jgi:hypothetical protein
VTADQAADAVTDALGSGKGKVPADALAVLIAKARRFDWVMPLVVGHDTDEARHRSHLMVMGYHIGRTDEGLVDWAMQQTPMVNGHRHCAEH